MSNKVNLEDKLSSFGELWSPKVIGELNGQFVKLVKCQGEYPWHSHAEEDEFFLLRLANATNAVILTREAVCVILDIDCARGGREFWDEQFGNLGVVDHAADLIANELGRRFVGEGIQGQIRK